MINKKKYGQFFTDINIAKFMAKWVMQINPKNLLDPAVGKGIFLDSITKLNKKIDITAFDIDNSMCELVCDKFPYATVKNEDYIFSENKKYDAIICNPPYNKFQKIKNRKKIIDIFEKKYNVKLSGYSNLCIYFLIKSLQELSINGRCSYIIPYEFLNTGYGKIIKDYLIKSKKLVSIIKFDNSLKLFEDAITTSCILLLESKIQKCVNFINISNINELENYDQLTTIRTFDYTELNPNEKWLKYFSNTANDKYFNLIPMNTYAQVKRGIATGNNQFFTLNNEKILKLGLSKNTCIPCITKSSDITVPIFNTLEFNKLLTANKKVYLFDGTASTVENDFKYIKTGEINGYDKTYLTSHRNPWFSIENKIAAPILLSVFCRNKIKVIRNELMIKNLTTFHGLYFKNEISEEYINIFFCYLLTPIAQKVLFLNKREYGDGLDKFEPNDFNEAPVLDIKVINKHDKLKILEIYKKLKNDNFEEQVFNLDNIFKGYLLSA